MMSSRVSLWNLRRFPVHSGSKGTFHCGSMSDSELSLSQWALTTQTQTQQLLLFWDKLQHKYFPNTQHKVPFLSKSHLQPITDNNLVSNRLLFWWWMRGTRFSFNSDYVDIRYRFISSVQVITAACEKSIWIKGTCKQCIFQMWP